MLRGNLVELEYFVAVAHMGGFRAAARELGLSSSALSQAIGALEARLGVAVTMMEKCRGRRFDTRSKQPDQEVERRRLFKEY